MQQLCVVAWIKEVCSINLPFFLHSFSNIEHEIARGNSWSSSCWISFFLFRKSCVFSPLDSVRANADMSMISLTYGYLSFSLVYLFLFWLPFKAPVPRGKTKPSTSLSRFLSFFHFQTFQAISSCWKARLVSPEAYLRPRNLIILPSVFLQIPCRCVFKIKRSTKDTFFFAKEIFFTVCFLSL